MSGLDVSSMLGYESENFFGQNNNPLVGNIQNNIQNPLLEWMLGPSKTYNYNTNNYLNLVLNIESSHPENSMLVSSMVISKDLRRGYVFDLILFRSLTLRTRSMLGNIELLSNFHSLVNSGKNYQIQGEA